MNLSPFRFADGGTPDSDDDSPFSSALESGLETVAPYMRPGLQNEPALAPAVGAGLGVAKLGAHALDITNKAIQGKPYDPGDAGVTFAGMGLGASPAAAEEGSLGIFGGRRSITANTRNLEAAKILNDSGLDNGSIWRTLGWEKNADGEWRYEISDKDMKVDDDFASGKWGRYDPTGTNTALGHVVDHPTLFDAYPQLKDMKIGYDYGSPPNQYGYYYPADKIADRYIKMNPNYSDDTSQFKTNLIHEIQHAVQHIEDWPAKGTNPEASVGQLDRALAIKQKEALDSGDTETSNRLANIRQYDVPKIRGYDAYFHEAGEVESRNAQFRNELNNPEYRDRMIRFRGIDDPGWQFPPSETADVPPDKQSVFFKNTGGAVNKFALGGSPFNVERAAAIGLGREGRSGFLGSGVPGRTDQIGLQVRNGSYVIPADVVSAAGQGNSLAGASAFDRLLKQGPYGTSMPNIRASRPMMPQMPRPTAPRIPQIGRGINNFGQAMKMPKLPGQASGGNVTDMPKNTTDIPKNVPPAKNTWGPGPWQHLDEAARGGAQKKPRELVAPKDGNWSGMSAGGVSHPGAGHRIPILAAGGEYIVEPETVARIGGGDQQKGFRILDKLVLLTRKKHIETLRKLKPPKKK